MRRWLFLGGLALTLTAGCGSSGTHGKQATPVVAASEAKDPAAVSMCGHLTGVRLYTKSAAALKHPSKQRAGYYAEKSKETKAMKTAMHESRVPAVQQIASSGGDPAKVAAWCHANGLMP